MQRDEGEARLKVDLGKSRLREQSDERVDHHVADAANPFGRDPFAQQVLIAITRRSEQQVGELIGDESIQFFRHVTVE